MSRNAGDSPQFKPLVQQMRGAIVRSELRTSYLSTVRRYFELYIDLLEQRGSTATAFEVSERSHARALRTAAPRRRYGTEMTSPARIQMFMSSRFPDVIWP